MIWRILIKVSVFNLSMKKNERKTTIDKALSCVIRSIKIADIRAISPLEKILTFPVDIHYYYTV